MDRPSSLPVLDLTISSAERVRLFLFSPLSQSVIHQWRMRTENALKGGYADGHRA
jgi:hypothetical protein